MLSHYIVAATTLLCAQHVEGQVTTCTITDLEAACFPAQVDIDFGCVDANVQGICTQLSPAPACIVVGEPFFQTSMCTGSCACTAGLCLDIADGTSCAVPLCPDGSTLCGDPHMVGLMGQRIDWSGVNGAWYSLLTDDELGLHVNVRLTAPLVDDFPDRQLITGIAILSNDQSLTVEVKNPYSVDTEGCPPGIAPCLSDGGLEIRLNGEEDVALVHPSTDKQLDGGITISASNLPAECRQFGGDRAWARTFEEMMAPDRHLFTETFEEWVLRFNDMAAPEWCAKFIEEQVLADVQSKHAIFRVELPNTVVRLNVGLNQQGGGEVDGTGRVLPELEFWQMDVGFEGLVLSHKLSGILGETTRPVVDHNGREIMKGTGAIRGTVEDYRVSDALGKELAFMTRLP